MSDKMMTEVLKQIKSALVSLDDRVQNLEIESNTQDMGSISQELEAIEGIILTLDNYYYDE